MATTTASGAPQGASPELQNDWASLSPQAQQILLNYPQAAPTSSGDWVLPGGQVVVPAAAAYSPISALIARQKMTENNTGQGGQGATASGAPPGAAGDTPGDSGSGITPGTATPGSGDSGGGGAPGGLPLPPLGSAPVSPVGSLATGSTGLDTGASALLPSTTVSPVGSLATGATSSLAGTPGVLSRVGSALLDPNVLAATGKAIGAATTAGQNNKIALVDPTVELGKLDASQRAQAEKDIYRQSFFANQQKGPYDPQALPQQSPAFMQALSTLEQQGMQRIAQPSPFNASTYPSLQPGTLSQIGTWLGPALSLAGTVGKALAS